MTIKEKNFYVPKSLYDELVKAAKAKGKTLTQYLDDLLSGLLFGEVVEHGTIKRK